ncbi:phage major capsid protein, partial [Shewanella sp. AS1]|uniref:phage major capsid protein n=1 Tax=Shewanella sp. AS1 TaxID=2907626 RepID=UPI001F3AB935
IAVLAYATDELLEDVPALESWLMRTVPDVIRFQVEDAFINGDGVGKPLGILNSPCITTQVRNTATYIYLADIANMWGRRWLGANDYVWIIGQDG